MYKLLYKLGPRHPTFSKYMFTAALKTELKMQPRAERNSHDATVAVITSTLNAELKMEPSTEGYSHSATVATMTSFYEFIKRMYGDVVVLKYPPPSGWPQITELPGGVWQPTPAVIQLLQHIPYFVRERSWDPPVLLEGARPVDYRQSFVFIAGEIAKEKRREEEKKERGQVSASSASEEREQPAEDDGRLPPHMFELARQYRHGYNIIVDTKRGVVIWWDDSDRDPAVGGPVGDAEPEDDCVKRWWKNGWKAAPTFRIETFFEMCKEQYTLLVSARLV